MLRKIILIGCLSFLLAGCATTEKYQHSVNSWQGQNIDTLVKNWGEPDAIMKLSNGGSVYMYTKKRPYVTPPSPLVTPAVLDVNHTPMTSVSYNGMFVGGQSIELYCRTWFDVNSAGMIVSTSFQGNNCISSNPHSLTP